MGARMKAIGQYEIIEISGEGGMGTVYKGRDPRFNRPVAIKLLHDHLSRDAELLERFKNEAIIQARLQHPNIVTVYDFVAEDGVIAMVMEYVQGRSLAQLIAESAGPLELARAVALMGQILSAMEYAHTAGLVHRDLKPANVIVQELAGEEIAKVLDFGIAKILGSEKLRTATSAKMGTLCYMSPEQLKSPKSVDRRSDIYSLGIMFFEMLTGQLPFEADSEFELMRQTVEQAPPLPSLYNPNLQPEVQEILLRALAKKREDRFASCVEMLEAVRHAASKTAVTAPRPELPPPVTAGPPGVVMPELEPDQTSNGRVDTPAAPSWLRQPFLWAAAAIIVVGIGVVLLNKASSPARPQPQTHSRQVPVAIPESTTTRQTTQQPSATARPKQSTRATSASMHSIDGRYFVQIGAFGTSDNVSRNVSRLEALGYTVLIQDFEGLHRVRAGPFADQIQAERAAEALRETWPPARVVKD